MRKIIIYSAILIVLVLMVIYKGDYARIEIVEQILKYELNNAAEGATLLLDEKSYSDGYVQFKDDEVNEYVDSILDDKYEYTLHIFDSKGTYRKYKGSTMVSEEKFIFPHFFTNNQNEEIEIREPCIIIEGILKKEFYSIKELKGLKTQIERSSMYIVNGRKEI